MAAGTGRPGAYTVLVVGISFATAQLNVVTAHRTSSMGRISKLIFTS